MTIKEADEVQEKLKVAEKAKEEGKEEMIISMHEEGFSNQQIAKISKKSEAEIALIIENHKKSKSPNYYLLARGCASHEQGR